MATVFGVQCLVFQDGGITALGANLFNTAAANCRAMAAGERRRAGAGRSETVGETIGSLLRQDYPGAFNVILVDDQSRDATADVARGAAAALGAGDRLSVISGRPLPPGWTGKLWAQQQGVEIACSMPHAPDYLLFTDADIVFEPGAVASLRGAGRA